MAIFTCVKQIKYKMKRYYLLFFFSFLSFFLFSQDNDEISNAVEILCDTPIESTTFGYGSDQEQLITWGLNDCGTSDYASP